MRCSPEAWPCAQQVQVLGYLFDLLATGLLLAMRALLSPLAAVAIHVAFFTACALYPFTYALGFFLCFKLLTATIAVPPAASTAAEEAEVVVAAAVNATTAAFTALLALLLATAVYVTALQHHAGVSAGEVSEGAGRGHRSQACGVLHSKGRPSTQRFQGSVPSLDPA